MTANGRSEQLKILRRNFLKITRCGCRNREALAWRFQTQVVVLGLCEAAIEVAGLASKHRNRQEQGSRFDGGPSPFVPTLWWAMVISRRSSRDGIEVGVHPPGATRWAAFQ